MTPEKLERARRITHEVIREVLDDVVFDEILVKPDLEKYDDDDLDYLEIRAIYEGERERLGRRTPEVRRVLRSRLLDEGITEFPIMYFTMKSEWVRRREPA